MGSSVAFGAGLELLHIAGGIKIQISMAGLLRFSARKSVSE